MPFASANVLQVASGVKDVNAFLFLNADRPIAAVRPMQQLVRPGGSIYQLVNCGVTMDVECRRKKMAVKRYKIRFFTLTEMQLNMYHDAEHLQQPLLTLNVKGAC